MSVIDLNEEVTVIRMAKALEPVAAMLPQIPVVTRIHMYCRAGVMDMPMRRWRSLDAQAQVYAMIKARMAQA